MNDGRVWRSLIGNIISVLRVWWSRTPLATAFAESEEWLAAFQDPNKTLHRVSDEDLCRRFGRSAA